MLVGQRSPLLHHAVSSTSLILYVVATFVFGSFAVRLMCSRFGKEDIYSRILGLFAARPWYSVTPTSANARFSHGASATLLSMSAAGISLCIGRFLLRGQRGRK